MTNKKINEFVQKSITTNYVHYQKEEPLMETNGQKEENLVVAELGKLEKLNTTISSCLTVIIAKVQVSLLKKIFEKAKPIFPKL